MIDQTSTFDPVGIRVSGNRYADQFAAAAEDLGLAVDVVDCSRSVVRIRGNGKTMAVRAAIVGCNNLVAARMSSNKAVTSARLQLDGFRVPRFESVELSEYRGVEGAVARLRTFAADNYPVVLKAQKGHGGINVHAGLMDEEDLRWATGELLSAGKTAVMIEQHVYGRDYRIKMFDGVVMDLMVRSPGIVEGDGQSTIATLIDRLNEGRKKASVAAVVTTPKLLRLLSRSGKTLNDVLERGEIQPIGIECNEGSGGSTAKLSVDCIPPQVAKAFRRVAAASGLRYLAIDFICDDIESDDSYQTGYINEINSAPIINEYIAGKSRTWYLSYARYVLEQYFELKK